MRCGRAMRPSEPVFVDANVPMYAAGADHPYRAPCTRVMAQVLRGELRAATSVEVHQEILHRYLSLGVGEKARTVSQDFEALVPEILPVTMADFIRARSFSFTYPSVSARDLVHVAVMLNHGLTAVVSADRHFDQIAEITRLDPMIF